MTREQLNKHWDAIKALKEGKEIQFRKTGSTGWENPFCNNSFEFSMNYEYREKPEQQKRPPTIEEVEKWFCDYMIFKNKKRQCIVRVDSIDINNKMIWIAGVWIDIKKFCKDFTHYDGSELYITEN